MSVLAFKSDLSLGNSPTFRVKTAEKMRPRLTVHHTLSEHREEGSIGLKIEFCARAIRKHESAADGCSRLDLSNSHPTRSGYLQVLVESPTSQTQARHLRSEAGSTADTAALSRYGFHNDAPLSSGIVYDAISHSAPLTYRRATWNADVGVGARSGRPASREAYP